MSATRERDTFEGDDRQYSPTRLRGWLEFVSGPDRPRPEQLPAARIAALAERELVRYNDRRAVWHANIGPIWTPQLTGRERFTNHAEWGSVTTGRWRRLPSSLRFFVASAASFSALMQRE